MSDWQLKFLAIGWLSGALGLGFISLIGATWYDLRQIQRQKRAKKAPGKRPLISVVIWADNSERCVEDCLKSITAVSYRKYEVIVIDNASKDATKALIRQFIAAHPKKTVKLVAKRRRGELKQELPKLLKKPIKGDLMLVLGADYRLAKDSLTRAADRLAADPEIASLTPRVLVLASPTILSLIERFESQVSGVWQKLASVAKRTPGAGSVALHRTSSIKSDASKAVYAAEVVIYRQPGNSYKRLLEQPRSSVARGLALSLPFATGYFSYLAIVSHYTYPLALSWAAFSFWLILAAWTDEHQALKSKLELALMAPVMFGLLSILMAVRLIFQIYKLERRALKALGALLRRAKPSGLKTQTNQA